MLSMHKYFAYGAALLAYAVAAFAQSSERVDVPLITVPDVPAPPGFNMLVIIAYGESLYLFVYHLTSSLLLAQASVLMDRDAPLDQLPTTSTVRLSNVASTSSKAER